MKFYQTVLQSRKKCWVQSWEHFYCDIICFHSSLYSLQFTSASLWHWSLVIECNISDGVSSIEKHQRINFMLYCGLGVLLLTQWDTQVWSSDELVLFQMHSKIMFITWLSPWKVTCSWIC